MSRRKNKRHGNQGARNRSYGNKPGSGSIRAMTAREASEVIRRHRKGISVVFSFNDDGTLADTVLLHDATHPALSRSVHILEIEHYLKPPLDEQVKLMIARWRAEQVGWGGRT